jgi:hypothetical protein
MPMQRHRLRLVRALALFIAIVVGLPSIGCLTWGQVQVFAAAPQSGSSFGDDAAIISYDVLPLARGDTRAVHHVDSSATRLGAHSERSATRVVEARGASTTPNARNHATNSSRLVPGGGLAAHEAAGGHTLARHVGMSDADLLARVGSSPGISGASSFSSRAVAEARPADLLAANSSQVSTWLGGTGGKLVLSGPAGGDVGRFVAQGSTTVIDATGSTVVLICDASTGVGYRIQTAFPTP